MTTALMDEWMIESELSRALHRAIDEARERQYPDARVVAIWVGESGSTFVWPQALVDNRRARVLGRIARYGIEPPATDNHLVILTVKEGRI